MTPSTNIADGAKEHEPAILALLPQLADFPLPPGRNPDDLWQSDADLLKSHFNGASSNTILLVATSASTPENVLGFALTSLKPELLSHEPSAHLEAIVVAAQARGLGLGRQLLVQTEQRVVSAGAKSLTLHAFARNERARGLYESFGFDGELIRYSKSLTG
ncbi:MAG: GNAT family N-acetyltransferase [Woeseiaceae bacterium]